MKKFLLVLLALVLIAGIGGAAYWWYFNQQVTAFAAAPYGSKEPKLVDLPTGSGPKTVANLLAEKKVVSDPGLLYAYLRREKLGNKLKAGEYEFAGELTPQEVIQRIISGQVKVYRFTVPEGLRVDEILPILASSELKLDLEKLKGLTGSAAYAKELGLPAAQFEGFLYPDTYTFTRGATEKSVLAKMTSRSLEELKKARDKAKPGVSLSDLEAMTLASIVEKETGAPDERPHISCVFHNRLRLKMKLQTDPTVIYAMMLLRGTYSKNITKKDLETSHPYNTYTMKGLPPGPIANPGAAAISAAYSPMDCNDLFFVSRNDGTHIFCPDLKCHESNVDKWQKEFFQAKRGKAGTNAVKKRKR